MALKVENKTGNKLDVTPMLTKDELYATYGDFLNMSRYINSNTVQVSVGTQVDFESNILPYGFKGRLTYISIYIPFGCRLTTGSTASGLQRTFGGPRQDRLSLRPEMIIPNGGSTLVLPLNLKTEFFEGGKLQFRALSNETLSSIGYSISITIFGEMISSDGATDAPYIAENVEDSIGWTALGNVAGGSGANPNLGDTHYFARLVNKLKQDGISIWRNNRSFGGATTSAIALNIRSGYYDRPLSEWNKLKLVSIGCGTNDAEIGTAASQNYAVNLKSIVDYYFEKAPNAAIILRSPPQTTDPIRIPNLPAYRIIMQDLVALYPGKQIKYVDTTTIGSPSTNPDNFTDTVHPRGDTGHLGMYNQAYPIVQTFDFYINRN